MWIDLAKMCTVLGCAVRFSVGFFRWTLVSEQWLVGSGYLAVVSEQCTVGSLS